MERIDFAIKLDAAIRYAEREARVSHLHDRLEVFRQSVVGALKYAGLRSDRIAVDVTVLINKELHPPSSQNVDLVKLDELESDFWTLQTGAESL